MVLNEKRWQDIGDPHADKVKQTSPRVGFKVLGTILTFDNKFYLEMENRYVESGQNFLCSLGVIRPCLDTAGETIGHLQIDGERDGVLVRGILESDEGAKSKT